MSINKKNSEILDQLLCGENLDDEPSSILMKRWLNDQILDVETGALLAALRAKGVVGNELSSMAKELLNVCNLFFGLKVYNFPSVISVQ